MSPLPIYGDRPCVLLTNDDGPPCASSPNIFGFYKLLRDHLGWDVKVVIPDCQKSWVGKAYAISDVITASYFYPRDGRNSSTAFALSSGTLGAALAGALSVPVPGPSASTPSLHTDHIPCIAVSYGVVTRPLTSRTMELAHEVAVDVCRRLWEDWGYEGGSSSKRPVQVYTVNVPLIEDALAREKRKVCWTRMWRNSYGQLFKPTKHSNTSFDPGDDRNRPSKSVPPQKSTTATAGPGALPITDPASTVASEDMSSRQLKFHFSPNMNPLLFPAAEDLPEGTDAWAFAKGYTSVTPLRAEYAGLGEGGCGFGSEQGKGEIEGQLWA